MVEIMADIWVTTVSRAGGWGAMVTWVGEIVNVVLVLLNLLICNV